MKYRFPGLLETSRAAGNDRWRVRQKARTRRSLVPGGPGTPGFDDHYAAARRGEKLETVKPMGRGNPPRPERLGTNCARSFEALDG